MPVASSQNELHESDERTVKHEAVRQNTVTKEGSATLEPISVNRSFVNPQSTPVLSDTVLSCNSSISSSNTQTLETPSTARPVTIIRNAGPTTNAALERHSIWQALHAAIPDCLEVMRENKHLIAWLEYRTPLERWGSTERVNATQAALEKLVLSFAALEPDALNVAIKSAVALHPKINPARQERQQGVVQLARFSRKEVSA